ncbi:MAG: bifunctional enoyl-CoA hydratase/phosphate acetyltransferase [Tissierellia bacterium]|nr:bifunctional enoyl-CoA hydratase/phosphate acetyltransferase [Tissierellia bacterium]
MKSFDEVLKKAKTLDKKIVAVAKAENLEVLEAVEAARLQGICDGILVGEKSVILQLMKEAGIKEEDYEILDIKDSQQAAQKAVSLVSSGKADMLMKGLVDTGVLLREVLNKEYGLRNSPVLSHVAVFEVESYHKLLIVTDAAMNIAPDVEQKIAIIENALVVSRSLGISQAKVALLAAKESVNEKMPATVEAAQIAARTIAGAIIAGPFALDNAVSKESARIKGLDSPVAGDADILVAPDIEAGNILYKALGFLTSSRGAGTIVGARRPIILTSRADSEDSKMNSIALAVLIAEEMKEI